MPHPSLRARPRPRIRPRGVTWLRKCGQVRRFVVPKGLNDRSQAIYCLEGVRSRIRPGGYGLILTLGPIDSPSGGTPIEPNHTVPYGTGPVFAPIPGNKLPGYDHLVPPGQIR